MAQRYWPTSSDATITSKSIPLCPGPFLLGFVGQIRHQPAFDFRLRHAFALGVAFNLIASDEIDGEVAGFGVGEVKTADAGAGPHGVGFGELDTCGLFDVEERPQ